MRFLTILFVWALSTVCFAVPYNVPAESGFRILRPGNAIGVGIPATAASNRDPSFPYWGTNCGESTNALCWPIAPRSEFTVPAGTHRVVVGLYSASSYNFANVVYEGASYSMNMQMYGPDSQRYYRLQTYADIPMTESNCTGSWPGRTLSPLSYESGVTRVYRLAHSPRWTSCSLTFDALNLPNDAKMSVSFNAMQFRYDNDIYSRLPSGTHIFHADPLPDRVTYEFYNAAGDLTGSGELFDSIVVSGWINLDGYLDFSLTSAPVQSITVGPNEQKTRYAYVDTLIKTNLPKLTTTIRCQYMISGVCALSDGDLFIPLVSGIRPGRLHTATFAEALRPNWPLPLNREMGFAFHKDLNIVYMFGIEPAYLRDNPETFGKTFIGDVTLIVEADFD